MRFRQGGFALSNSQPEEPRLKGVGVHLRLQVQVSKNVNGVTPNQLLMQGP
jgi:hypothetical protein